MGCGVRGGTASTFVALLFSPVEALTQTGFAVAAGLLLDTFVVRTLVVSACASLFEDCGWWPPRNPTRAPSALQTSPHSRGRPVNRHPRERSHE